jgi:primosomal protein N' (replication factor Y)
MKNTSKPSRIDPAPRYHARDAAVVLASFYKAKVLLGSATPSIETILTVSLENMV